jgi:hypothetical protein
VIRFNAHLLWKVWEFQQIFSSPWWAVHLST